MARRTHLRIAYKQARIGLVLEKMQHVLVWCWKKCSILQTCATRSGAFVVVNTFSHLLLLFLCFVLQCLMLYVLDVFTLVFLTWSLTDQFVFVLFFPDTGQLQETEGKVVWAAQVLRTNCQRTAHKEAPGELSAWDSLFRLMEQLSVKISFWFFGLAACCYMQ